MMELFLCLCITPCRFRLDGEVNIYVKRIRKVKVTFHVMKICW